MQNHILRTLLLGVIALPASIIAQPSAHYAPGLEGLKAATLPPPGIYLRDYNYFYYADRVNDQNGDKINGLNAEAFIYANAPRVLWITDIKVLGGNIGFDALIPLQYSDVEIGAANYDESDLEAGDLFGEVTWSWHEKRFDAALGYGLWAPTGDEPAGLEFWTHMLTAGATFYFDEEKRWSLSALNRYEISTEQNNTDDTVGDVWTIEGGLAYSVAKTVDVGPVAYYQKVLGNGEGQYATMDRAWVAAVGPEVSVFYPRITFGWSLRYLYEVAAENRMQGHTAVLTLTKRF
jgi:hypothetical protein